MTRRIDRLAALAGMVGFFLVEASARAAADGWVTDLAAAMNVASETKRDILMDFTGSDWCGGCIQLEKRVLSKEEFITAAGENFVLLEVDFPQRKEQSAELKTQNEALSEAFAIEAFPTLMLCDAEGRPYAEAGFPDEMTPAGMLKDLEIQRKTKAARDAAFAKAEKAEGIEKATLLIEALALVPPASVIGAYSSTIDAIAKADPDDKSGFVRKARTQKALSALETEFGALMGAEKVDEAIKLIDAFVKESDPSGEAKQKALLFKVFGLATKEEFTAAGKLADEILAIDDSTETAGMAKQVKRQLESQ